MIIAIGGDHTSLEMKSLIAKHLRERGADVMDFGPEANEACDYPVYAEKVAIAVRDGVCDGGVLICGTGAGMGIAANKVGGVRAAICSEGYTARLAKEHNNANVICFGARVVGPEVAKEIVDAWLDAAYQGGRHDIRVRMYEDIEKRNR